MIEYIERDAAIEVALSCTDAFEPIAVDTTVKNVVSKLRNIPYADVQPVKHGEWKHVQWVKDDEAQDGGYWISRCSNCIMPYHFETPYCPHCGAKMDGEE